MTPKRGVWECHILHIAQVISLPVIGSVTVLLQEVIFNEFGHLQSDFICLSQRCLWAKKQNKCIQNQHKYIKLTINTNTLQIYCTKNIMCVLITLFDKQHTQTYLSNKLHNLSQVLLLLQNLFSFGTQRYKLWEVFVIVLIQRSCIFTVTDQPVNRREVFPLGKLLI